MLIGHKKNIDFLNKSFKQGNLAHAYLFIGSEGLGKKAVALEFAATILGQVKNPETHPDVLMVEPEIQEKDEVKKELNIGIDQTKKVHYRMSLSPYQAPYKIAIIDKADTMTEEAGNSLLKLLGEPTEHTLLILITSKPKKLLPTIVSRCQQLKFLPVEEKEMRRGLNDLAGIESINVSEDDLEKIIRLSMGRPGMAVSYLKNPSLLKDYQESVDKLKFLIQNGINERYKYVEEMSKNIPEARSFLRQSLFWYRDVLFFKLGNNEFTINPEAEEYKDRYSSVELKNIIRNLIKTDSILANPSFNARLALEVLMLEI